ncbi:hypothetical protein ZEAMMB73_Zm00001d033301 [Zea mays]|uniref:Uncharacterized protein n=2 Tax=Zea mays TaxID=4577 RepID=A0A1D6KXK5_MAIZE|nr:hypothetical protein ZEAMMB73_Zm00001d033301 [Zea mays]
MFLGSLPRRPSKEAAYKQLRSHIIIMASCAAVIRATPYILHFLARDGDIQELKLDLFTVACHSRLMSMCCACATKATVSSRPLQGTMELVATVPA